MAGIWTGTRGLDVKPKADGPRKQAFVERIELQPIDPVTNGPQLFYGLRYYIHITKPDQVKTYHEQVGYWLWEPATGAVIQTLAIPRGQIAMASGTTTADATSFELVAKRESTAYGICSNPFEHAFTTVEYRIKVDIHADGTGLRRGHGHAHPRQGRTVPPHGPQPADENRRADAEPDGLAGAGRRRSSLRLSLRHRLDRAPSPMAAAIFQRCMALARSGRFRPAPSQSISPVL
jgi:hypothetical protein